MRDLLQFAQKTKRNYNPSNGNSNSDDDDKTGVARQTIDLFFSFFTSKTGLFLKKTLVNELSEIVDSMASIGEANLLRVSNGFIRPLPGGNGPVNLKRVEKLASILDTLQSALSVDNIQQDMNARKRFESLLSLLNDVATIISDGGSSQPLIDEVSSVARQVAVRVLEKRGSRAMRSIINLSPALG